jgi:hypothetical protein
VGGISEEINVYEDNGSFVAHFTPLSVSKVTNDKMTDE